MESSMVSKIMENGSLRRVGAHNLIAKQGGESAFSELWSLAGKPGRRGPLTGMLFKPSLRSLCFRASYDAVTNLKPGAAGGNRPQNTAMSCFPDTLGNSMNEGGNWLPRKPSTPGNYYCNRLHTPPITETNNNLSLLTGSFLSGPLLATAPYWRAELATSQQRGRAEGKCAFKETFPIFLHQVLNAVQANCCSINRAKMKSALCSSTQWGSNNLMEVGHLN